MNSKVSNLVEEEKDRVLINSAIEFLSSRDGITKTDVELHLTPVKEKPNDLKDIYRQFCFSAQNRQMSAKVIGGSIGDFDNLRVVLFDFSPQKVAEKYSKGSAQELLNDIQKKLNPKGQMRTTNRSLWPQYCQSVIDSAHFIKSFDTADDFYKWANFFTKNSKAKPALPLMISVEVSGFGFPLACDFLKELGYTEYGKPDVHLKNIFEELGLIDPNEKSALKQNYEILKVIDRIAHSCNKTAYAVDKIFWLIGSGDFYRSEPKKKIGSQKQKFISEMKKKIEIKNYIIENG